MIHTHTTHVLALDKKLRRGKEAEAEAEEESVTGRRDLHIKQETETKSVRERKKSNIIYIIV
jgi:hypothetical protein